MSSTRSKRHSAVDDLLSMAGIAAAAYPHEPKSDRAAGGDSTAKTTAADPRQLQSIYRSQPLRRSKDPEEVFEVSRVFREICAWPSTIFGNGLETGDALLLSALANVIRVPPGERLIKVHDMIKDVAIVVAGSLVEIARSGVKIHLVGAAIGEVGLVSDSFPAQHSYEGGEEGATVALLPFQKLNSFLDRMASHKSRGVYQFLNNVMWPKFHEQDTKTHLADMAILVQMAFRCHLARKRLKAVQGFSLTSMVIYLQRVWRKTLSRLKARRARLYPHARLIQRSYRMHLARQALSDVRRNSAMESSFRVAGPKISFRDRVHRVIKVLHDRQAAAFEERRREADLLKSIMLSAEEGEGKGLNTDIALINKWLYGLQAKIMKTWKAKVGLPEVCVNLGCKGA